MIGVKPCLKQWERTQWHYKDEEASSKLTRLGGKLELTIVSKHWGRLKNQSRRIRAGVGIKSYLSYITYIVRPKICYTIDGLHKRLAGKDRKMLALSWTTSD